MILARWDSLPEHMKNEQVKVYYDILKRKKISLFIKRCFDFVIALVMLVIISPILLLIAILIKTDSKGPVFYRQERITAGGKVFKIFKFRTMVENADKIGSLVTTSGDNRITKLGSKIRKYRLDELPQLLNIIVGDMSFVGTRPEVKKYVAEYSDEMLATLLLPAGVTSLASITFKDETEIIDKYTLEGISTDEIYVKYILPEKMKYNLRYMKEFNIVSDIILMIKTAIVVTK